MRLIDMHCDTISLMMRQDEPVNLKKNTWCVDLEKMKQADRIALALSYEDLQNYHVAGKTASVIRTAGIRRR